jgi:holo-[acyl-carrier protein] synthase
MTDPLPVGAELRFSCATARHQDIEEIMSRTGLADVFSPTERAHSGKHRNLDGFAGRLAGKYAVADAFDLTSDDHGLLRNIQIVPAPRNDCGNPAHCERGHPPTVRFDRAPERLSWIDVSITHEAGLAFAAAVAIVLRP